MTPSLTPLAISANHRYLVDGTGTPFLIQGDAGWELIISTTQPEADQYLTARASQGFNLIQVNLIDHLFGPNAPANMAGDYPFFNSSTGQHRAFIDAPNEAYFAYADWVINDAASKGMYVLLDPSYLGYAGTNEGFYSDMQAAGSTAMRQWGQYVGNRYKDYTNIIWQEGADQNPPADGLNFVNQVALGIKDAGANQLQTAHTVRESSAQDVWGAYSWLNFNSTYTSTLTYARSLVDYNRTPVAPSFLIEDIYENENGITQKQDRAEKYWNVLSGSTGALMGNSPIWAFDYNLNFGSLGSWKNWLNSQMATDMSRLGNLFESQPWYNLVPDQGHTVVTAGYGTFGQSNYVTAARTGDGTLVMAYVPSSRTLTVDLTKLSNAVTARWYDPTNGSYTTVTGNPFPNTGSYTFTTPGNNSNGDGDWVLVLEAPSAAIPSAPNNLVAAAGDTQVSLCWDSSSGATSYNIYASTTSGDETLLQSGVTATSYMDTGLTNDTTYFYKVAAVNSAGTSDFSEEAIATPQLGIPAAPTNLSATAGDTQVTLSWTSSSSADSYNVYRSTTSGAETLLQSSVATTSFLDTGLDDGTTYYYRVAAVNSVGTSAFSNEASATPQVPAPPAPTDLSATAGNAQVSLAWSASSSATSYNVYRSTSSGAETLVQSGVTTSYFTDTGRTNGTTYYYKVAAVNAGGTSGLSNEASAKPQIQLPSAPTNLTATAGNKLVSLSWTASSGATSYKVYRSTTSGAETLLQSGVTTTTFTNTSLTNGKTYFYKVAAVNSAGTSTLSNEASATPQVAPPAAPTNLTASAGNTQVSLAWTASSGATSYQIYRSTESGTELLVQSGVSTPSFTNTGLSNGTTYFYRVAAVNAGGASGLSNEASAAPVEAPTAPTDLTTAAGNKLVTLSWTASGGATSYKVYRSTSSGAETLLQSGITSTSFTNTGLTNGTTYFYKVAAVNAGGTSGLTNEVSATPHVAPPTAPTSLIATAGNAKVSLSWTASSGATSYQIYRSTASGDEILLQSGVTTTSFTNSGLTNGTTYFYKVAAINAGGISDLSSEASATPQVPPPAAPTNLTASAGNTQVSLAWTASSGATSYQLYRSTTSGNETLVQSGITTTSFTDTGLTNGTTYFYKVAAVNAVGTSSLSNEASATPTAATFTGAHINFSTSTGEAVNGYRADTGFAFGDRGNGLTFGWNADNTAQARDRDLANSPDELHDSFNQLQRPNNPNASWEIAVPNGTYTVHLGAGDAGFFDSVYKINVEGVLAIDGTPTSTQHWFENTLTVIVTDGRLTISNAAGAVNNKINFIDITPLS